MYLIKTVLCMFERYKEKIWMLVLVIGLWSFFAILGYALSRHHNMENSKTKATYLYNLSPAQTSQMLWIKQLANLSYELRGYTAVEIPTATTTAHSLGDRFPSELGDNSTHSHFRAKRVRLAAA